MLYQRIIRPLLFTINPERIHTIVANGGEFVGRIPGLAKILRRHYRVTKPNIRVHAFGVDLPHPVGLSAGFDKDGRFLHFAEMLGFAFSEVGSITAKPYAGNKKPWLRRLKSNQSLVVNYGLKSKGADSVYAKIKNYRGSFPFGISVAKTNSPACVGNVAVEDYAYTYGLFHAVGLYNTLNLSCPNTADGTPFSEPKTLEGLLKRINEIREQQSIRKPLFIKIGPDVSEQQLDAILELIQRYHVDGMVISNLFKDPQRARAYLPHPEEYNPSWKGGLSGRAVQRRSTELIAQVYRKTQGKIFIIGCGGIYNAEDAYKKIRAGANVLEMITGFIYGGPATIRHIALGLSKLVERDGFSSIEEVRGINAR